MRRPRFTVALPVRNGGQYLKACVGSVLSQTFNDYQLVILENGSTDGTREWVQQLGDPRVAVLPAPKVLSIEENWQRILTIPKGDFLTTIGHDDLLDPDFLDVVGSLVQRHPDAGLYLTHFRLVDGSGKLLRSSTPMPERETAAEFLAARLDLRRDSFGTGHVMRACDYERVGGFPPYDGLLFADDSLWLRLMEGSYRATSQRECFSYRLHTRSASGHPSWTTRLEAAEKYWDFLLDLGRRDARVAALLGHEAAAFFRRWTGATYEEALLAACRRGERLEAESREAILRFAESVAPGSATGLRTWRSARALDALNATPLRRWGALVYMALRTLRTNLPGGH